MGMQDRYGAVTGVCSDPILIAQHTGVCRWREWEMRVICLSSRQCLHVDGPVHLLCTGRGRRRDRQLVSSTVHARACD